MTETTPPSPQPETEPRSNTLPILVGVFALVSLVMAATVMFSASAQGQADGQARIPANGPNTSVGWDIPEFDAQTLTGETVNITDYRDQVVLLNFWATWCIPCQREMPAFNEFMAEGRDDAVILAVNHGEENDAIIDYINLYQLDSIPILLDPDFELADGLGVMNLPVTYVIDGQGTVQAMKLGEVTREDIDDYVAAFGSAAS